MTEFQVPRGLLITADDRGDRMYLEQERLRKYFPAFRFVRQQGTSNLAVLGVLKTNPGNRYGVKVVLPDNYPYRMPTVEPAGWSPGAAPHQLVNGLCIMKSEQWTSFYTIAFVVGKTALWLNKYDVWRSTGSWPGNQQYHGFRAWWQEVTGL